MVSGQPHDADDPRDGLSEEKPSPIAFSGDRGIAEEQDPDPEWESGDGGRADPSSAIDTEPGTAAEVVQDDAPEKTRDVAVDEGGTDTEDLVADAEQHAGLDEAPEVSSPEHRLGPLTDLDTGMGLALARTRDLLERFVPPDAAELPREVAGGVVLESVTGLADVFQPGLGSWVRAAYYLVSGPEFRSTVATFGRDWLGLKVELSVTEAGWSVVPGVGLGDGTPPAPTGADLAQRGVPHPEVDGKPASGGTLWWEGMWWIESSTSCAIAVKPRTTIRDLTGCPVVDGRSLCSYIEHTTRMAQPCTVTYLDPDSGRGLVAWKPMSGDLRVSAIFQLSGDRRRLHT